MIIFIVYFCLIGISLTGNVYHNQFAVRIRGGTERAKDIGREVGMSLVENIFDDYFLFEVPHISKRDTYLVWDSATQIGTGLKSGTSNVYPLSNVPKRSVKKSSRHEFTLESHPHVIWFEQMKEKRRTKRNANNQNKYQKLVDPLFKSQWHLNGGGVGGSDMNVIEAWKLGFAGDGVVVTILDDGIQHNHPDLKDNYDSLASKDINDNDDDPMPQDNGENKHGTRCAGEVAAVANNKYCGVGIAYNASIGGVRMLDGMVNDAVEARSLSLNPSHIDIYSASWGPEDDGKTVDGPGPLAKQAFYKGITEGRNGKGSIFIWASGNGGHHTDNCNCDGYTNSIYTLSISSATQAGTKPWYLEECSSTLATTFSSGTPGQHASITTVDQDARLRSDHICTSSHTGTSASAPLAAGVCALALQAAPNLTWRDLQYLVVLTSNPKPLLAETGWQHNSLGRLVSHKFGYGLLDAGKLVQSALTWSNVPSQKKCETRIENLARELPPGVGSNLTVSLITDGCDNTANSVRYLEHIQAVISLRYAPRGDLKISLLSPRGTQSFLLLPRPKDRKASSFDNWPFLSVHYWGEDPTGEWKLIISNAGNSDALSPGILKHWQLVLYGTRDNPVGSEISENKGEDLEISSRDTTAQFQSSSSSCHQECQDQCHGPGPQECYQCKHFRYNTTCVPTCPTGSFSTDLDKQKTCLPCHQTCQSCYGPNSDQCDNCNDGKMFVPHLSRCVSTCPTNYTSNVETGSCEPCPKHCRVCRDQDTCLTCDDNTMLSGGQCVVRCGPQSFYDDMTGQCDTCHPNCHSCVGPTDVQCESCKKNLIYFERRCVPYCPAGYRVNKAGSECLPCPRGCDTCPETSAKCHNCSLGWSMTSDGLCVSPDSNNCQPGLYWSSGTCLACHLKCKTCSGPRDMDCTTCYPDHRQYLSSCVETCSAGTYPSEHGKFCISCPHTCASCSVNSCQTCKPQYYLQDGKCVSQCNPGHYADDASRKCLKCSGTCYECHGPDNDHCLSCHGKGYLANGKCTLSCPDGSYSDTSTFQCLTCHSSCDTCHGPGGRNCSSCHKDAVHVSNKCVSCSSGNYFDPVTHQCDMCHDTCFTCSGPAEDQCLSCPANLYLDSTTCSSTYSLDFHNMSSFLVIVLWLLGGAIMSGISYCLCGLLQRSNNFKNRRTMLGQVSYSRVGSPGQDDKDDITDDVSDVSDSDQDYLAAEEENQFLIIDKL